MTLPLQVGFPPCAAVFWSVLFLCMCTTRTCNFDEQLLSGSGAWEYQQQTLEAVNERKAQRGACLYTDPAGGALVSSPFTVRCVGV